MTDTDPSSPQDSQEPIDVQFEPAPDPEAGPKPGAAPGWTGVAIAAAIAALAGAAGGAWGAGLVRSDPAPVLRQQIADLASQQAEFERRIAEMPEASDDLSSLVGEVNATSRKLDEMLATGAGLPAVDRLTARIEALERIDPAAGATPEETLRTITALEARLSALEAKTAAPAPETEAPRTEARRAEAALALSAIEAAARRGTGFEADYRTLRAAAPNNQTVRRLSPYVGGVATLSRLQAEFPAARAAAAAAARAEVAEAPQSQLSWLSRVLGDAVSVRPASRPEDPSAEALETAAAALSAGDLSGAVKALATLEGGAGRAVQDWTREANRRITLESVLEDTRLSLIEPEN
ncbi:MAG: COG4223 family protein [Hyphomonas sp.]